MVKWPGLGTLCHKKAELKREGIREADDDAKSVSSKATAVSSQSPSFPICFFPSSKALAELLSSSREITSVGHQYTKNYKVNRGQSGVSTTTKQDYI